MKRIAAEQKLKMTWHGFPSSPSLWPGPSEMGPMDAVVTAGVVECSRATAAPECGRRVNEKEPFVVKNSLK